MKYGKQLGGFGIELLYPGAVLPQSNDTGIAGFGRIDHAIVSPGTLIQIIPLVKK